MNLININNQDIANIIKHEKSKFFILGDSRTGTLSMNNFFNALGFKSKHYFVEESKQILYNEENLLINTKNIINYIKSSDIACFSDYPTRLFYKELAFEFPNSYFILTVRKDIETWKKSMEDFFLKFKIKFDILELSFLYESINNDIRYFFKNNPQFKFLELCIDEDSVQNSEKIKLFIDVKSDVILPKDNQTKDVKIEIPSQRFTFSNFDESDPIKQIQLARKNYKGMLSEYGWIYLINDSNQFLDYLYNKKNWNENELLVANYIFNERKKIFNTTKCKYWKFIIPEKMVIYKEFLPKSIAKIEMSDKRPAKVLREAFEPTVSYLDEFLNDVKSYGFLYFRGDTHPNWLGGYFIYQYIIKHINFNSEDILSDPIPFSDLSLFLAGYEGDLFKKISPDEQDVLNDQFGDLQSKDIFEHLIRYELPLEMRKARSVTPDDYLIKLNLSRGVIIKEVDNPSLPSVVIFRDSTADFIIDLLAEHFRRSVFVWHHGQVVNEVLVIEKPDLIIHVMAERFVVAYGNSLPPTINITS